MIRQLQAQLEQRLRAPLAGAETGATAAAERRRMRELERQLSALKDGQPGQPAEAAACAHEAVEQLQAQAEALTAELERARAAHERDGAALRARCEQLRSQAAWERQHVLAEVRAPRV